MATNEEVMDIAMEWLVIMNSSSRAELQREEFETWRRADPSNQLAYELATRQYADLQKAMALPGLAGAVSPEELLSEIAEVSHRDNRRRELKRRVLQCSIGVSIAATVTLAILVLRVWVASQAPAWMLYTGVPGIPTVHRLTDGSELYLNGQSTTASVRITAKAREIHLERGEIAVQVKRDVVRPFLVDVGSAVVRATGTLFSVRRSDMSNTEVRVQEGAVQVDPVGGASSPTLSTHAKKVGPGQVAVIPAGGTEVQVKDMDSTELEYSLAWREGHLYLHGTLLEAVAQFNEHNQRKLVIDDSSIQNMNVTGIYGFHDLGEFVELMRVHGVLSRTEPGQGTIHLSGSHHSSPAK